MKTSKKNGLFLTFAILGLAAASSTSCDIVPHDPAKDSSLSSSEQISGSSSSASSSFSEEETSSFQTPSEESMESKESDSESNSSGEVDSIHSETSSESSSSSLESSSDFEPKTFNVYYINDFHGAVEYNSSEVGMKNLFTFLKNKVDEDPEHTIVLAGGDMWQGSFESNSNKGKMITEAMNAVPFDAMVLGNHDFDYGIEALEQNMAIANFPMLGGNIVNYPDGTKWSKAIPSTTIVKDGVKIGIIGNIGQGQTTSITSPNVAGLDFRSPMGYITNEAAKLKADGCKLIINLLHDSVENMSNWSIYSHLKDYVDGAFTAHTHKGENALTDNVPILQAWCNGKDYSQMTFTVTPDNASCTYYGTTYAERNLTCSPAIESIYNKYITGSIVNQREEVLGYLNGTLSATSVARLGIKAVYEKFKTKYPDLVLTMENSQRATLHTGDLTYSALYQATPFENKIVFARVPGSEIKNEARYNPTYTGDPTTYATLQDNEYYLIGVIDFLYYHQNTNKRYDYFASASNSSNVLGIEDCHPVDASAEYIKGGLSGRINASEFGDNSTGFDLYYKLGK